MGNFFKLNRYAIYKREYVTSYEGSCFIIIIDKGKYGYCKIVIKNIQKYRKEIIKNAAKDIKSYFNRLNAIIMTSDKIILDLIEIVYNNSIDISQIYSIHLYPADHLVNIQKRYKIYPKFTK